MATRDFSKGFERCADDAAGTSWLCCRPRGWFGHDFVRAIHLRAGNLPTQGLPYNAPQARKCRAGCQRVESVSHILQACPVTHAHRIQRHNEVVQKLAKHVRKKGWPVGVEPRMRHPDGQLFIPDLAIHLSDKPILICDVQVNWEGPRTLAESWQRKILVYDHPRFREVASKRWPGKTVQVSLFILGARGVGRSAIITLLRCCNCLNN